MNQHQQQQAYEYQRMAAAGRSYMTPAIITLVLYWLLWIPGFIANLIYLNAANEDRHTSGVEPQGRGCLIALLVVFVALPILGVGGIIALIALQGSVNTAFDAVATPGR